MIRLPLDAKSLYLNIANDNESGHTATVATPLLQGKEMVAKLAHVYDIPENVTRRTREGVTSFLLEKSRAEARIQKVFVFDKITVNHIPVEAGASYCIYIREETGKNNVHCGRLKIHYPIKVAYSDDDVDIDNRAVMTAVSKALGDFAFVVNAFEYDARTSVLNFDATIVGTKGIPYSKVFVNRKGGGSKYTDLGKGVSASYDTEIIPLREALGYENVSTENFESVQQSNRAKALAVSRKHISDCGGTSIVNFSEDFPGALYDFSYVQGGRKHFAIVRFTASKVKYFDLSGNEMTFCRTFPGYVHVLVVTDVLGEPRVSSYDADGLDEMNKAINSVRFTEGL